MKFIFALIAWLGVLAAPVSTQPLRRSFDDFQRLAASPMQVRLLPGHDTFSFTLYGAPASLEDLKALVDFMRHNKVGNGFDPGPSVSPANHKIYEFLREVRWPVVGYANTADHQVKKGACRLSERQHEILQILDEAGIFAATQLGEWGYYFHNLSHNEHWWRAVYGDDFEQWKHLMKPEGLGGYDEMPKSRRECHDIFEDYFRTRQRYMKGWNLSITGHSHYEAYAGQWGAKVIGLELGENIAFTQSKMAFARGAARRNGKPWSVQVSQWFHGSSTSSGPLTIGGDGTARGLDAGHSLSFFERMWLHAWFAGTAMVTPEASFGIFFEEPAPPYRLTSHGRKASKVFQFMQSKENERGIPFTPIAIVVDQYCGYNAYMGKPWGILTPSEGDSELRDLLQEQLFPGSDHIHRQPFPENPEASYLRPTPFGEIFDVQLSDAPAAVLSSYPVILLAGDHELRTPLLTSLHQALTQGSRVLVHRRHAQSLGSEGLAQLMAAGQVEILNPWINPATNRSTAISNPRLTELAEKWLPVKLSGDPVLFQINRTSDGWVIELVNNRGVVKFPDKPAIIDPAAIARVMLHSERPFKAVVDWQTGAQLSGGDDYCITIGPGQTKFIKAIEQNDQDAKKATSVGRGEEHSL